MATILGVVLEKDIVMMDTRTTTPLDKLTVASKRAGNGGAALPDASNQKKSKRLVIIVFI
jgi:hypothetical protein